MDTKEMEKSLLEAIAPEDVNEVWKVDTLSAADWALNKIRIARQEMAEIKALADMRKADIDRWAEEQTKALQSDVDFFTEKLKPFIAERLYGKKTKTLKLVNGSCSFKKSQPKFQKDENEILAYVKANDEMQYVKTKESLDWVEFKKTLHFATDGKMITADGEVVPGVTYTVEEDTFTVKTEE